MQYTQEMSVSTNSRAAESGRASCHWWTRSRAGSKILSWTASWVARHPARPSSASSVSWIKVALRCGIQSSGFGGAS